MATFAQAAATEKPPITPAEVPSGVFASTPSIPTVTAYTRALPALVSTLTTSTANKPAVPKTERPGKEALQSSGGFDFFEDFHVVPRAFDFGNLLSDQSTPIEVFSAYRRESMPWSTFTNNAGAGVELGGEPSLPVTVAALTSFQMTLDVSTAGDPFVDSTLVFFFSGTGTITVPIVIQRIVLWGLNPELPYSETLGFLTDIHPSKDGSEQRAALRKNPRQAWGYSYIIEEGSQAQILENMLFDFQSRNFGVPVWFEDAELTVAVIAGDTTITVNDTAWRDFHVDGRAVIFTDQGTFDVLEIDSLTSTSLTFSSPSLNSYVVGAKVYPLAVCRTTGLISGDRFPVGLQRAQLQFSNIANDINIGDLSAFSSYNGKLLLDNGNSMIAGNVRHSFRQDLVTVDGGVGLVLQDSTWDRHKRGNVFTLRAEGRQAIWEMRQMIHALRGRNLSFYVPRDSDDLTAAADLLSASNTIDVDNVGYAQFVRNRSPRNHIRINFVDGSTPVLRAVTASVNVSTAVDRLTVDTNWASTITVAEISRIDFVELVRLDTDKVRIDYDPSGHRARMVAPILGLFG